MAKSKRPRVSRRDFLRNLGAGVAGAALLGSCRSTGSATAPAAQQIAQAPAGPQPSGEKARVAVVRHSRMLADETTPSPEAVLEALDVGVKHVFGEDDALAAWRKVAGPEDVVAIKASCISGLIYSTPEVAYAIAHRLQEVGVVAENIVIWERSTGELERSRFTINRDGPGVRCYGTDGAYGGWLKHRDISVRLAKIAEETATVLINMPVLKHHGGAGVTLSMKNHYGCISDPGDLHANNCDQAAQLSDVPALRDKTRLIVCDAARALCDNGPGGSPENVWPERALIVSTNMVAADAIGLAIIDAERARRGLGSLVGQSNHIASAAALGLGPNDRALMDVLETEIA